MATHKSDMDYMKLLAEIEAKKVDIDYRATTTTTIGTGGPWGTAGTGIFGGGIAGGLGGIGGPTYGPLPTPPAGWHKFVDTLPDLKGALVLVRKGEQLPMIANAVVIADGMSREEKIKAVAKWLAENE